MAATTTPAPARCGTCNHDPKQRCSDRSECSHVECPTRRIAWSERVGLGGHPNADLLGFMFDHEEE